MDLSIKKSYLTNNQNQTRSIFNKFNTKNNYMGVYFSNIGQSYITFKSNNTTFSSSLKLGTTNYILAFIYTTSDNFTTQTNTFLSS